MKKRLKKLIAILATGILLTSTATAYAAQVTNGKGGEISLAYNDSEFLGLTLSVDSYCMSNREFSATFKAYPVGNYQFRTLIHSRIEVYVETAPGSGIYDGIYSDYGILDDVPTTCLIYLEPLKINLKSGQHVLVTVYAEGEAFGDDYLGTASGYDEFTFIMP